MWIRLHVKPLPYQTFPGIFSSIDSYNKRVVHGYFDREGAMPSWLRGLGDVKGYIDPPSYQKFSHVDPGTGVTLRGTPDGVFQMRDGSYTIVDYKTAKYTPGQEKLLPLYRAQLNGYAYLGNRLNLNPVSQLALVYMEPVTDQDTAATPEVVDGRGFVMALSATVGLWTWLQSNSSPTCCAGPMLSTNSPPHGLSIPTARTAPRWSR